MRKEVIVLTGAGSIGVAIIRRIGAGKHIIIADLNVENAKKASEALYNAGFEVTATIVDISSRESILELIELAQKYGTIKGFVNAAGVSPSQASIETILKVDLYGTAVLLDLPMLSQQNIKDTLHAYQLSKRCNGLRVMYESVKWGKKGARINSISPGIIITPLANDELNGPRGEGHRKMIELCPAGRAGTPDEVAEVAALVMSENGTFITGSDFLIDGGVTASYWYGELKPNK